MSDHKQNEIHSIRTQCWHLSWPAMLSGVMIPLMGMVDTAVVGRLSESKALGAVALGAWLFDVLYWSFGFLRMGTTGLSAQAYGKQDHNALLLHGVRAIFIAVVLGGFLITIASSYLEVLMPWLSPNDQQLNQLCERYFMVRICGGPAVLVNYVVMGWLLGIQKSRWVLYLQALLSSINMGLSILWGATMGVAGVATASVVAQIICALIGSFVYYQQSGIGSNRIWWQQLKQDRQAWWSLWKVNRDLMLRSILLLLAFGAFHSVSVRQSTDLLAANALLLHLQTLQAFVLDGFAHAMEAMIGQALGAKDQIKLRLSLKVGWEFSTWASIGITLIYIMSFEAIVRCFTQHQQILSLAKEYQFWAIISPICSAPCFLLDGIMIGATRSRTMFIAMFWSVSAYGLLLYVLPIYLGNHGIFLALIVFMLIRACTLYPHARLSLLSTQLNS